MHSLATGLCRWLRHADQRSAGLVSWKWGARSTQVVHAVYSAAWCSARRSPLGVMRSRARARERRLPWPAGVARARAFAFEGWWGATRGWRRACEAIARLNPIFGVPPPCAGATASSSLGGERARFFGGKATTSGSANGEVGPRGGGRGGAGGVLSVAQKLASASRSASVTSGRGPRRAWSGREGESASAVRREGGEGVRPRASTAASAAVASRPCSAASIAAHMTAAASAPESEMTRHGERVRMKLTASARSSPSPIGAFGGMVNCATPSSAPRGRGEGAAVSRRCAREARWGGALSAKLPNLGGIAARTRPPVAREGDDALHTQELERERALAGR